MIFKAAYPEILKINPLNIYNVRVNPSIFSAGLPTTRWVVRG